MFRHKYLREKKLGSILVAVCCLLVTLLATAQAAEKQTEPQWRLDAKTGAVLPRSWRFMTDEFTNKPQTLPSRQGLDKLRCSASAEFSGTGLALVKDKICSKAGKDAVIYVVDLRRESHGFVNGDLPVSSYVKGNRGNLNLSTKAVEQAEKKLLQSIVGQQVKFVPLGKTDTKLFGECTVQVKTVETEKDIAAKQGMRYKRIAITDQAAPADTDIDDFMAFYASLPRNAWLHFHCHAGHGRTTTFAVFYDILCNPDVALADIADRQYALGGTNLFQIGKKDSWKNREKKKRAQKIRSFYAYVQANRSTNFAKKYSQWVKEQPAQ